MPETYYEITASPYKFKAAVFMHTNRKGVPIPGGIHRIRFGGKNSCVAIDVYEGELYPNLNGLGTGVDCAMINMDAPELGLLPGPGTIRMAKAALKFMLELFPHQKAIYLKDKSRITCNNGSDISFAHFYLAKHLKTWYQAKFDATLVNPANEPKLAALVSALRSPYLEASFDEFFESHIRPVVRPKASERLYEILKPLYESQTTYHGWFKAITENYDCSVMKQWMEQYMNSLGLFDFGVEWAISKETIAAFSDIRIIATKEKPLFPTFSGGGFTQADAM